MQVDLNCSGLSSLEQVLDIMDDDIIISYIVVL